jgi:hypothetical protein
MGCKKDTLMIKPVSKDEKPWIHNLKKSAISAATASIGLIDIWDPSSGNIKCIIIKQLGGSERSL